MYNKKIYISSFRFKRAEVQTTIKFWNGKPKNVWTFFEYVLYFNEAKTSVLHETVLQIKNIFLKHIHADKQTENQARKDHAL